MSSQLAGPATVQAKPPVILVQTTLPILHCFTEFALLSTAKGTDNTSVDITSISPTSLHSVP